MEVKHTLKHQNLIGSIDAPGLRRNVITPNGKREQLWGKGIRGQEAEEIINSIYSKDEKDA